MLLAIDIGNTTIVLGAFEGERLQASWYLSTDVRKTPDEYAALLLDLFGHRQVPREAIHDAIISSVVPPLTAPFQILCRSYLQCEPVIVEPGIRTGVRVETDNPREVGADRVVNAAAVHHLHPGPAIVIDFGTATTFDVVSEEGDYLGGAIAPGVEVALEALFARAARLPRVDLQFPRSAIGKNTVAAMQSGLLFGYLDLVEGLVTRLREEMEGTVQVIATGGLAGIIAARAPFIDRVEPGLTLEGLRVIYEMNRPSG